MQKESQPRRLLLFKILVPAAAVILSLVMIELGLAIFYPVPFSIATNMYFEADPYTGWRIKPGGTGFYQLDIPANGNSRGNRDVEVSLKKPAGVFRILVLGDSFTVGTNVRQEEAYSKVLERQLRNAYGPKIEVVNAGTGAWDPFQYAQYFEHYGYRFEPDLILVGFFVGNDTYEQSTKVEDLYTAVEGQIVTLEAAANPAIKQKVFLYNHSHLARLLMNRGPVAPRSYLRKQCDDFTDQYLVIAKSLLPSQLRYSAERREKAQNALNQISRIKQRAGAVPVMIALFPDENQVNKQLQERLVGQNEMGKYDFSMPQPMLIEMFRGIGLPVMDTLPAFLADQRCLYMNDGHWTAEGQAVAAGAIREQLSPVIDRMKRMEKP